MTWARRCALLVICVLLAGCSTLFKPDKDKARSPAAAASAPGAPTGPPAYDVVIEAPDDLKPLLTTYLDLERFRQQALGSELDDTELDRLIAAVPAQAHSLLETEGYFEPEVTAERQDGKPVVVRVAVVPGARSRVRDVELEVTGPLQSAIKAGNTYSARTLESLKQTARDIDIGEPFRQATWTSIKATLLAKLQNAGYAAASWKSTHAKVDTANRRVDLHLVASSGPLFHVGDLKIEGLRRYDERTVHRLAHFKKGDIATEALLLDFQERLQKAGLFETASVEFDLSPSAARASPVTVRVKELTLQQATVGVGISANTGPRVSLEHTYRKVFGLSAVATNNFEVGRDRKAWVGSLTSFPLPDNYRNLVSGSYEWLDSADEIRTTWSARAGRSRESKRIDRLNYVEAVSSRLVTALDDQRAEAVSLNTQLVQRYIDNQILPTRGHTDTLQLGTGFARSNFGDNGPFVRAYGRLTVYRPFAKDWNFQGRIELGQVFTKASVGIPDTLLFRAGGDDSVRGYAYRTLGPEIDGVVQSGRVLMTSSLEVAKPMWPSIPALWGAVFIDAGQVADRWSQLRPDFGYGVGVRFRSPVGALRADIAYGQAVQRFRFHLSIGVAL